MGGIIPKPRAIPQGKHWRQIRYLARAAVARRQGLAHNPAMDAPTASSSPAAPYPVAVIMERVRVGGRWAAERWEAKGVVQDVLPPGSGRRVIVDEDGLTQILFPGFTVRLQRAEAEGYYLNITSPLPKLFVLWRMRGDVAQPELLTVSYNEGTRWADSGENVDGVALPADWLPWLGQFIAEHYRPEPRRKPRYASSRDKGVASQREGVK
jgi:hypothetical protein